MRIDYASWLRVIAIVILTLAAAVEVARIAVAVHTTKSATVDHQSGAHRGSDIDKTHSDQHLSALITAHLFGVGTQSVIQTSAPAVGVQWTLSGTLAGSSPSTGSAIVSERGRLPLLRTVGEEISNGFKLVQVGAESVVLDRDGQRVTVNFARIHAMGDAIIVANDTRREDHEPTAMPAVWRPRKGWPQNRPPAMVVLRPQVHLGPSGHYNGMQVMGGGSALATLGLQRGDVITQVNGTPLKQPGDAQLALAQMSTSTPVMVTVERGGRTQQLAVSVPDERD